MYSSCFACLYHNLNYSSLTVIDCWLSRNGSNDQWLKVNEIEREREKEREEKRRERERERESEGEEDRKVEREGSEKGG